MSEDTARYVTVEELDSTVTGQNMRGGAFVLPIVDYDPTTETRNVEEGACKLWVSEGRLHFSVFSLSLNKWTTLSEEHVGTIKMFFGSASDIDVGWQLCDGTNGTPDLRDKFILGGEFADVGNEEVERATVIANHGSQTLTIGNHVDDITSANGSNTTDTVTDDGTSQKSVLTGHTSHIVSLNLSHAGSSVADADAHVVSTQYFPPYYTLAFIMKVT